MIEIPNVEPAVADRRVNLEPPENVEQEAQNENNANVARPRNVATGDRKRRRPRQKEAKNEATGLIEPHIRQINDHIIHMDIPIQVIFYIRKKWNQSLFIITFILYSSASSSTTRRKSRSATRTTATATSRTTRT